MQMIKNHARSSCCVWYTWGHCIKGTVWACSSCCVWYTQSYCIKRIVWLGWDLALLCVEEVEAFAAPKTLCLNVPTCVYRCACACVCVGVCTHPMVCVEERGHDSVYSLFLPCGSLASSLVANAFAFLAISPVPPNFSDVYLYQHNHLADLFFCFFKIVYIRKEWPLL